MTTILLRAPKDPFEVVSPETRSITNTIADNSGNLIFLAAAYKILATRGTTVTADRLLIEPRDADRINERYDAYVIPLANAFRHELPAGPRPDDPAHRAASRSRSSILGVGAQANLPLPDRAPRARSRSRSGRSSRPCWIGPLDRRPRRVHPRLSPRASASATSRSSAAPRCSSTATGWRSRSGRPR